MISVGTGVPDGPLYPPTAGRGRPALQDLPQQPVGRGLAAAAYFDRIGSVVVSCYLLQCGARTVKENRKR